MLRRRRREGADQQVTDERGRGAGPAGADDAGLGQAGAERGGEGASGPWDVGDDYPQAERVDCGSLLIPAREGFDVQINEAEEQGAWVAVVNGDSGMQLQAFAAPRSGGLWDEVRHEIAANIAESGGSCEEETGRLGAELHAQVPIGVEEGVSEPQLQSVRFIGCDGPRWFLRGVISGPAAADRELGMPFDDVFADVVVVRGDYPAPPREQLEIRLPEEMRQALEAQFDQENPGWGQPNPFARGPEITETR